jgi:hypothetical protein
MPDPSMQMPVTCPECAMEFLSELSIAVIAGALLTGNSIRLYAGCHDIYWTATFVERERLRQTLGAMKVDAMQPSKEPEPLRQFNSMTRQASAAPRGRR